MNYDFDQIIDRRAVSGLKWDVEDDKLPMWVADMDFAAAPEITAELEARIAHGIFGYEIIPVEWYHAYAHWWKQRHDYVIEKDWLVFSSGVVPAISSAVRALTAPGEKVLIQSPVYNIFFNSIINNGRQVLDSPLKLEDMVYNIDWRDLEAKLNDPLTTLMILCNPHNPVGKIWDRLTLRRIGELCKSAGVTVLSDEVHCDITSPRRSYTAFASASQACADISISCLSPGKSFNLAGLHSAAVIIPNPHLRRRMIRALNNDEIAEPSTLACTAAIAAYQHGAPWLDSLRSYLEANRTSATRRFSKLPGIQVIPAEATYLLWIDCRQLTNDSDELADFLGKTQGLIVSSGASYGNGGQGFLRLNLACPAKILNDGLDRFERGVVTYPQWRSKS